MHLLLLVVQGDGFVGAISRRLVSRGLGALLDLRLVVRDDVAVVGAFADRQERDEQHDGYQDHCGLLERGGNADLAGKRQEESGDHDTRSFTVVVGCSSA